MAKKQTRRSVSIRGITYQQLRNYCEKFDISMSEFVEERIAQFFGSNGVDVSKLTSKSMPTSAPKVAVKPPVPVAPARAAKSVARTAAKELDFHQMHDAARCFTF